MIRRPFAFLISFFVLGICAVKMNIDITFLLIAVLFLAVYLLFYKPKYMAVLLAAAVGFSIGALRYKIADAERENIIKKYDGCLVNAQILALDFSSNNSFPAEITFNGEKIKVYAYIENCDVQAGNILKGELLLSAPKKDKNSSFDFASYLSGRNIYLSAYGEDLQHTNKKPPFLRNFIYEIRRKLSNISKDNFDGNSLALFSAMVFGDKRFFTDELSTLLQKAGQNHIAVVSGMHLSIMSTVIMMIIGLFFGKKRIGSVISIGAVIFMTLITGAGASVVRACVMCILFHASKLLRRETDGLTSLSIAVLLMVMYNPFIINNAGFVLSVLSVLGIILYSKKFINLLQKFMPEVAANATGVCLGAQITVVPAVMYYFGIITPYAIIGNLLIFALASMMVVVGMIFAVISGVGVLRIAFAAIINALTQTIISVCKFIDLLPYSIINTGGISPLTAVIYLAVLISVYYYPRHKKLLIKLCAAATALFVCASALSFGKIPVKILDYTLEDNLFIQDGDKAVFIGCTESDDALRLIERYCTKKEIYVVATSKNTQELQYLIQSGKIHKVVLHKELSAEYFIERIEKTGSEIILLNDEEELFINSIAVSYCKNPDLKDGKIIKLETERESLITAQSLSAHDIKELYKNAESFNATYFIAPSVFDKTKDLLLYMVDEQAIVEDKQIFLKR